MMLQFVAKIGVRWSAVSRSSPARTCFASVAIILARHYSTTAGPDITQPHTFILTWTMGNGHNIEKESLLTLKVF